MRAYKTKCEKYMLENEALTEFFLHTPRCLYRNSSRAQIAFKEKSKAKVELISGRLLSRQRIRCLSLWIFLMNYYSLEKLVFKLYFIFNNFYGKFVDGAKMMVK